MTEFETPSGLGEGFAPGFTVAALAQDEPSMTRRRSSHQLILPPAPQHLRPDALVAAEVGGVVGLLLWLRLRDIMLWIAAGDDNRMAIFQPVHTDHQAWEKEASLIEPLSPALRTLEALARYPELVKARDVAASCSSISAWAAAAGYRETALHFAEAAALADPLNAELCAEAGTACVLAAASVPRDEEPSSGVGAAIDADRRAEIWFERGRKIGRRMGQWEWYIRCRIRAGMQAYELGDYEKARRSYRGAHATAAWRGFPDLAGKAHHDMMLIECAVGTFQRAEAHLYSALSSYPVRFQRLPQLVHDAAYMFVRYGAFQAALEILDAVYPLIEKPTERIAVMGTMARAAAGVGQRARYRDAVADVLLYAALSEINAAGALVLAAQGALDFRDWNRSSDLATYCIRVAERRREREPQRLAEQVLAHAVAQTVPVSAPVDASRVHRTKVMVLDRLAKFRAPDDAPEARNPLRAEVTKFTMTTR